VDRTLALWRRAAAEGLAACALVFAACGAIVADTVYDDALGAVGIGVVFGLVIMAMVYATGHLSGAHINPAVTVAFMLTRHFPARDASACIAAQLAGATAAALALPARSFGPALATGQSSDFWVHLAGPLIGASAGALAHQLVRGVPVLTPTRRT
jgi:aquaporin NIP